MAWQSKTDRRRSLLEQTRRMVGKLFHRGLSTVPAKAIDRIKSSLTTLGYTDLAKSLDKFIISEDPQKRFKIATKLVLSLDQLALSLIEPPQLMTSDVSALQGCHAVQITPSSVPKDETDIKRLASSGRGVVELLEYIRSHFDVSSVDSSTLMTLLTNAHLTNEVLARMAELNDSEKLRLGSMLVGRKNRLLQQSGAQLLLGLANDDARLLLLKHMGSPIVSDIVSRVIRQEPAKFAKHIYTVFDEAETPTQRRELARHMRIVRPGKDQVAILKELEKDEDEVVAHYATLALYSAGSHDVKMLRRFMADVENHILRIYAKIELFKAGEMDRKYILAEFNSEDAEVHQQTLTALRDIGRYETLTLLEPIINDALYGKSRSIRKGNLKKIIHLAGDPFEDIFMEAAFDPDPEVAEVARDRLVQLWGFQALELFHDPWKAISRDPTTLSLDEVHALNYYILPRVPLTGDCRFTAYLGHLFLDFCSSGRQYDFDHEIKPRLLDFGEPMIEVLAEYLFVPDQGVSLAAEDLLLNIGGPTSKQALADFHSGTPPVEVAFRQLGNPKTAEQAQRVIMEEGPGTIPTLLGMLSDPKCRSEVLKILVQFADPSTFPAMLRLLGNPAPDLLVSGDISVMLRDTGFADRDITVRLVELGDAIVDPLIDKLEDANWTVRYHASLILGKINNARAIPSLIRLLQREQESLEVVRSVVQSLGAIGATEAVPLLTPYLNDINREIRFETYNSLALIGNPEATGPLREALATCKSLNEKRAIQRALEALKG